MVTSLRLWRAKSWTWRYGSGRHQGTGACRFEMAPTRGVEAPVQQGHLDEAEDAAQGVVELVGHAAGHSPRARIFSAWIN